MSAGLASAIVMAAALTQLLRSQLSGVGPLDPVSYASAVGTVAAAALVAIILPARKAARLDPSSTLRCE